MRASRMVARHQMKPSTGPRSSLKLCACLAMADGWVEQSGLSSGNHCRSHLSKPDNWCKQEGQQLEDKHGGSTHPRSL